MFENPNGAILEPWEQRIFQMWKLVKDCHIMPWQHDPDYDEGETMLKPEDKADILRLNGFEAATEAKRSKR